jgi:hypothetical protein
VDLVDEEDDVAAGADISLSTFFSRSSKSPRHLEPHQRAEGPACRAACP